MPLPGSVQRPHQRLDVNAWSLLVTAASLVRAIRQKGGAVTGLSSELADQAQRLREVTELPGRLAEILDVATVSKRVGLPEHMIAQVLNGDGPALGQKRALERLLAELKAALKAYEATMAHPRRRTAHAHAFIACARGDMPPDRWVALARWVDTLGL